MKDLRSILSAGLVTALETATGKNVYTLVPDNAAYPYIHISDIYQRETGSKTSYRYEVEVLIQVVHRLAESKSPLFTDMDNVLGFVKNATTSITLSGYTCEQCILLNSTDIEMMDDINKINIGLIRIQFTIS